MKKILLPTDFSDNSWNAIQYALKLYKDHECDFYVLNVFFPNENLYDILTSPKSYQDIYEKTRKESEVDLNDILNMIATKMEKNTKHKFFSASVQGDPLQAIKEMVETKDIEMIVMGTKGAGSAKNRVFGGTATEVMEKARNCPVIVVPNGFVHQPPKEIVFPTSYKTHFKRRELIYLIEIAKTWNAAIRVLHISEEDVLNNNQLEHRKMLKEYFEDLEYSFHTLTNIKIQTAVNCFVESRQSDMVTFINKKHNFFGSLLTTPFVKGISYQSKVPILVLHDLRN